MNSSRKAGARARLAFLLALLPALTLSIAAAPETKGGTPQKIPIAAAASGTIDLGQKLAYLRVADLAGELPAIRAALAAHPALVIDLRGVTTNIVTAQAFRTALIPPAEKTRAARFVLINAATASAIPFALGSGLPDDGVPGVVAIAPSGYQLPVDLRAPGGADDDRRACEAIAAGKPPASLLNRQPQKQRYDEAALLRDYDSRTAPAGETSDDVGTLPQKNNAPAAEKGPPPLTDSVLQLAVNVHRALLSLKKL